MKVIKAYKVRVYPTKAQIALIQSTFGCCRFVYNYFLSKRQEVYTTDKRLMSFFDTTKLLTSLKQELVWLKEVDKFSLENSLKDLDTAYKRFFKGSNYPKFKSKKDNYKSYKTNQNIWVNSKFIKLPKLGKVRFRGKRNISGRIINATIIQEPSGKYYVSLCCEVEQELLPKTNQTVGIDLGIKDFAILSTGEKISNHKYLSKSEKRLCLEQRRLSRKTRGSKNWEKQRLRLARIYEKVKFQRNDFLQKLSTELVTHYDIICIENLNVSGLMKNHKLAKSISDVSWTKFIQQLTYKCEWYGKTLVKVGRFYPSSQICNVCGFQNKITKDLKIRYYTCSNCNTLVDRDVNASKNILNEGLKLLAF